VGLVPDDVPIEYCNTRQPQTSRSLSAGFYLGINMSGCESQGGGEGPKPDAGRAKGGVGFLGSPLPIS